MYRFLLTPRWWVVNVFAALAIAVCLVMGSWQLSRFETRVDTHQEQEEQQDRAATDGVAGRPMAEVLPVTQETTGDAVTVTGRYGPQLLVPDRTLDGETGFYVLTLLRTDDPVSDDGAAGARTSVPVLRGWLPGEADPAKAPEPPAGEVTVTGALQASEHQGSPGVHTEGGLPRGQVGMISAAALVNVVDEQVSAAWVTLFEADGGMRPVPAEVPQGSGLDLKAFQNLGYTAQWFVFAGFVIFMWYRLFRREAELARDRALGLTSPDPDESGPRDPVPDPAGTAAEPGPEADDGERSRAPASTA
ncbi:SURF1 family protein [Streptomyces sp. WMMC500]|nr:SURF1 family protein [Streptomyces sp. WMMC500]WBB58188.1 SURF1 family protein [Streptomyces sp. WMMC500]